MDRARCSGWIVRVVVEVKPLKPNKTAKVEVLAKPSKSTTARPGSSKSKQTASNQPKHSKGAEKAHPAPDRETYHDGKDYAEACRLVNEARIAFDAPKLTTAQKLDAVGIDVICEKVADCNTLQVIAGEVGISKGSLIAWLANYPDQYARAREAQADKLAEDIIAIADDSSRDVYRDENGNERTDSEVVQRSKLRVDARKWLAGKMAPKKYGDRLNLDADVKVTELPDEKVMARILELQAKARGESASSQG